MAELQRLQAPARSRASSPVRPSRAPASASRAGRPPPAVGNQALQRQLLGGAIQAKLVVNPPGDAFEQEADQIADRVVAGTPPTSLASAAPAAIQRVPEASAEAAKIAGDEEEERKARLRAMEAAARLVVPEVGVEEEKRDEGEGPVQAKAVPGAVPAVTPAVEAAIGGALVRGQPLSRGERQAFEPHLGRDLGAVRLHTDGVAARAALDLGAQAFTHRNHIFFASGAYQPATIAGRRLLAHEVAHTQQQAPGPRLPAATSRPGATPLAGAVVQRADGGSAADGATATTPAGGGPDVDIDAKPPRLKAGNLPVPPFKLKGESDVQHAAFAGTPKRLFRAASYVRDATDQAGLWQGSISADGTKARLVGSFGMQATGNYVLEPRSGPSSFRRLGRPENLAVGLSRPFWRLGDGAFESHDVDHMVELQVAGYPRINDGNTLPNMAMVNSSANRSSGGTIRAAIERKVREFLDSPDKQKQLPPQLHPKGKASQKDAQNVMRSFDIVFEQAVAEGSDPDPVSVYYKPEIESGKHIEILAGQLGPTSPIALYDLANPTGDGAKFSPHTFKSESVIGGKRLFLVYSQTSGGRAYQVPWNPTETARAPRGNERFPGVKLTEIQFTPENPNRVGALAGRVFYRQVEKGKAVLGGPRTTDPVSLPVLPIFNFPDANYAGYIDTNAVRRHLAGALYSPLFSPIEFSQVFFDDDKGLTAIATIGSTVPFLNRLGIDLVLQGDDLLLQRAFDTTDFALPPPIEVRNSTLLVAFGLDSGLKIDGRVDFGIRRLGDGHLAGRAATNGELALEGGFSFDKKLFDPAEIAFRYAEGAWSGEGRIGIGEGKVPGVKSALLTVGYAEGRFTAEGTVEPTLKAIQQGRISLAYAEAEGLTLGGRLDLSPDTPGLRGGFADLVIKQAPGAETYDVRATGEAQPAIPGIDATLALDYHNGAFTVVGQAAFQRGMLSGALTAGVTNRAVGEDGQPAGEPTPTIIVCGGGEATIRIAPWLQGTAGVRFLSNGEVEVKGAIGLPAALQLFPAKTYERNILRIGLDIPIVGVSVARRRIGIFATVGGGLDLSARVGPGELRELGLEITYNPAHEDQTRVSGGARLAVPAHAGLRLFVKGGLGAGIPIVSATANLEVGGRLGLEGAAVAAVEVDWMPLRGLVLDASGEIYVEPRFVFDITGSVLVEASLLVTDITLYEKRWRLAEFAYGSGLHFGILFPIYYEEGRPFDISWSQVRFQVPDIDPGELLKGLVRQIV